MSKENPGQGSPRQKKQWTSGLTVIALSLLAAAVLAFYGINIGSDLFGLGQDDQQIEVEIPSGTSATQIGRLLADAGVIDHPHVFNLYAGVSKASAEFQAGTYVLNSNLSYDQIIIYLRSGNSKKEVERITFYEGMGQREIANLLEEKGICSAAEFHRYLEETTFDYPFMNRRTKDERFRPMEGYLFPDTYDFYVGERVSSVVDKFLSRFEQMMDDELYGRMKELNLTLDETITLASMIQEECSDVSEMGMVSGVFHNRLNDRGNYPRLQSDVTIFYVNKDIKPFLNIVDQELFDKYNTYVRTGLPIGPIASPGLQAIRAALYPEENDYYYFLTDSEGKFYYAKTYAEHQRYWREASKSGGGAQGIGTLEE